jgi:hypothetical protein
MVFDIRLNIVFNISHRATDGAPLPKREQLERNDG